ncbi:MAG: S-methyl-5-thioribose-1-phosphate isomerase [Candidatus Coatesbacteria bacterium]|nr:S-methyl-5-thioribose-1-phosphate isomerase [Candidatus Coatesbacteria bacterium]
MLDQRILPEKEIYNLYDDYEGVADAIKTMVIRGAPAIGVAAAMGIAIAAEKANVGSFDELSDALKPAFELIASTRPTAVNLFWALDRMRNRLSELQDSGVNEAKAALVSEALAIRRDDVEINRAMGRYGAEFINDGDTVLTHCNAGALATAGYGTALGVIRAAVEAGKMIDVLADETRPFLQGARLTAWELHKDGIPVTLITDNMAGAMMAKGMVQKIVVGADRIAANGDVANKIGTYSVAVLAKRHGIPFFVAAPLSTIDRTLADGSGIPIEERSPDEVTHIGGYRIVPKGVPVKNPAFDVTPNELVSAIFTEKGVARADYRETIAGLFEN